MGSLVELRRNLEVEEIQKALAETGGNKAAAARMLGMNRTTLTMRLRALGIDTPERYQPPTSVRVPRRGRLVLEIVEEGDYRTVRLISE